MRSASEVIRIESGLLAGGGQRYYQHGVHHYQKGNVRLAAKSFERAIEADPSNGAAHNNLGITLYDQRQLVAAQRHFETAMELMPNDATPVNNLAMTLEAGGDVLSAIEAYSVAHSLEPDNPLYLGNLLRARIRRGEYDALIEAQLQQLAYIDHRHDWITWTDEQLALHFNAALDRGPAEMDLSPNSPASMKIHDSAGERDAETLAPIIELPERVQAVPVPMRRDP